MIVIHGSFWATTCFFTHFQHLNTRLVSSLNSGLRFNNLFSNEQTIFLFVNVSRSSLVLRIWDVALSVLEIVSVSVMGTWHTLKRFSLTLPKVTINLLSDRKLEPSFYSTIPFDWDKFTVIKLLVLHRVHINHLQIFDRLIPRTRDGIHFLNVDNWRPLSL